MKLPSKERLAYGGLAVVATAAAAALAIRIAAHAREKNMPTAVPLSWQKLSRSAFETFHDNSHIVTVPAPRPEERRNPLDSFVVMGTVVSEADDDFMAVPPKGSVPAIARRDGSNAWQMGTFLETSNPWANADRRRRLIALPAGEVSTMACIGDLAPDGKFHSIPTQQMHDGTLTMAQVVHNGDFPNMVIDLSKPPMLDRRV
jgi:hypothetical protein